eukprot:CAMPEP_0115231966 /NCGR_PEP_ID=MMETSP0270-20121206/33518_1 /TAXON_ID=71861 /ORGANISM="Scrippsiella trochoidea, Strain CCMP3099" /LENGTH=104 /DNA_ID=CAMNT_0002646635 /DNA_START=59 /DNA_END=373 /DNA_ORIENTATION=+
MPCRTNETSKCTLSRGTYHAIAYNTKERLKSTGVGFLAKLLHLREQVHGWLARAADLERARQEVILQAEGQVDLDAPDEAQVPAAEVIVDTLHDLVLDHVIRLV